MSTVVLILLVGILALLYHCTHYALRGGGPGNSDYCGSFVILLRFESSNIHVTYGAALSFKLSTRYANHGGASYYGDRCGHSLVNITAYNSANDWNTGAALLMYTLSSSWWSFL